MKMLRWQRISKDLAICEGGQFAMSYGSGTNINYLADEIVVTADIDTVTGTTWGEEESKGDYYEGLEEGIAIGRKEPPIPEGWTVERVDRLTISVSSPNGLYKFELITTDNPYPYFDALLRARGE